MSMAHILGSFGKWAATLSLFGFSVALSFMFFQAITPPDKAWFAWAALGLTEGGLALWMIVFRLMEHDEMLKSIAIVMVVACAVSSVTVAGTQFYLMLATHYDVSANPQIFQLVSIMLEAMFALHMGAFLVEMIAGYFANPQHAFRGTSSSSPRPLSRPQPYREVVEQRTPPPQPKEATARIPERTAPVRQLPPSLRPSTRSWEDFSQSPSQAHRETQEEQDDWLVAQKLYAQQRAEKIRQREEAARSRVLVGQPDDDADGVGTFVQPPEPEPVVQRTDETEAHAQARQRYRQLAADDRKAESERDAKSKKRMPPVNN